MCVCVWYRIDIVADSSLVVVTGNVASGATSDDYNIPCQTVDSSQGKGNMMVWGKADWNLGLTGREALERNFTTQSILLRRDKLHKQGSLRVVPGETGFCKQGSFLVVSRERERERGCLCVVSGLLLRDCVCVYITGLYDFNAVPGMRKVVRKFLVRFQPTCWQFSAGLSLSGKFRMVMGDSPSFWAHHSCTTHLLNNENGTDDEVRVC